MTFLLIKWESVNQRLIEGFLAFPESDERWCFREKETCGIQQATHHTVFHSFTCTSVALFHFESFFLLYSMIHLDIVHASGFVPSFLMDLCTLRSDGSTWVQGFLFFCFFFLPGLHSLPFFSPFQNIYCVNYRRQAGGHSDITLLFPFVSTR